MKGSWALSLPLGSESVFPLYTATAWVVLRGRRAVGAPLRRLYATLQPKISSTRLRRRWLTA
jgi:hypothetical protein